MASIREARSPSTTLLIRWSSRGLYPTFSADARAPLPWDLVVARELEILGSHGMAAHDYEAMLSSIAQGLLDPGRLVGRTISLDEAPAALMAMNRPQPVAGMTVILPGTR